MGGRVRTKLTRDGSFFVYVGEKDNPCRLIATGNVNTGEV